MFKGWRVILSGHLAITVWIARLVWNKSGLMCHRVFYIPVIQARSGANKSRVFPESAARGKSQGISAPDQACMQGVTF